MDIGILALVVFGNCLVFRIVVFVLGYLCRRHLFNDYLSLAIILSLNLLDQFLGLRSRRERSFTLFALRRVIPSFIGTSMW